MIKRLNDDLEKAKQSLADAQQKQAKYANQHRREVEFKIGDQVLLSTENLQQRGRAPKLMKRFEGPFNIIRIINPVAYELDLPDSMRIHPVFHISKLKKYNDGSNQFPDREHISRPPPIINNNDDEEEYEAEAVKGKRVKKKGRKKWIEYLVKWRN